LVSDSYGVYQEGVNRRQTCLAHLIRTARGLSTKQDAALAACGRWALRELQRLCHMAKAPSSGGEWRAWYARFCPFIDRYHDRQDDAGRLARRLQREMVVPLGPLRCCIVAMMPSLCQECAREHQQRCAEGTGVR